MRRGPYELLGVARTASADEIRRAFRSIVAGRHSDQGGDPDFVRDVTAAYNLLRDPTQRHRLDLSETSEALLVVLNHDGPATDVPVETVLHVPLLVALRGGTMHHRGETIWVPRGATSGDLLRPSPRSVLRIQVMPHPLLGREGPTLQLVLPLSALEAYRGGPVAVPTPWGEAHVRLRRGTVRSGDQVVLAGYGVRCVHQPANGPARAACPCRQGDLRLVVAVGPLPAGDAELLAALERLEGTLNPRAEMALLLGST
jgi:DnaJ-class molecular chaperone